jgi:regulator of replication initiation timing
MYNLSSKFNTFYKKHVVLPKAEKNGLFNKKNINVDRLKEGLIEYNEEHGTSYKLAEDPIVQGSVAMSTVTQNETNDYDIDVAIIFDKSNLPEGTTATKNIIVDSLKRKCKQFKTEPEAKTNCIRIIYQEGYHIDFAIYRRYLNENDEYVYEHCGSEWRERSPRSITKWFLDQNKSHNYKLREVVRLIKMFSKSRDSWKNMPGGLIQSVLSDEQLQTYSRIDERFYYTATAIRDRLLSDKDVYNPVDSTKSLKLVSKDNIKMTNLYNRLNDKLSKLSILFEDDCTYNQAIGAWEEFFNHNYWTEQLQENQMDISKSYSSNTTYIDYEETEEYIQYLFPISLKFQLELDCKVTNKSGQTVGWLNTMLRKRELLLPNHNLEFIAQTNTLHPFEVYWKVKNRGEKAEFENCVRGQIIRTDRLRHNEPASFKGDHYVECYIVKNGLCVAQKRIPVPIKL